MRKWWLVIFVLIYLLLTFFGLGPVLFADGSNSERLVTFLIVIGLYIAISCILWYLLKK
ncbi:hypothetical protein JMM81_16320 [Bacillus sp. V3B]|uniref:DUF6954 family protein n=1 Tax=Bacillus sp. V3B TaxID=2804915 RepID=UPI002108DD12|nr:hypothetical protein [Bacillus sp. V3B]MCQ6276481.1 hypothetical protein [Bacillus sp. V3B]